VHRLNTAEVRFSDLEFRRASVWDRSTASTPYARSVPIGMPKIPERMLDNVFYLYGSEDEARAGKSFGGTGFLVLVPSVATAPRRCLRRHELARRLP
jgi:hypothetical protein